MSSRKRFRGLSRDEAGASYARAFPEIANRDVWRPLAKERQEKVVDYLSDWTATVTERAGEPGRLVTAVGTPLRTKDASGSPAPVDLNLSKEGNAFAPRNPVVSTRIPEDATTGVTVDDVRVELMSADPTVGVQRGDQVFFANVATDTDFLVRPSPHGVETFAHLRSPDSPTVERLKVVMPEGARLVALERGGAEVRRAGDTLTTFHPPRAADAQGREVPVEMTVDGDVLAITTAHTAGEYAYPILVDPTITDYWDYGTDKWDSAGEWNNYTGSATAMSYPTSGSFGPGRYIYAPPGIYYNGNIGEWNLPTYRDSFYVRAVFYDSILFYNSPGNNRGNHWFDVVAGIWSDAQGVHTAATSWNYQTTSGEDREVRPDYSNTSYPDFRSGRKIVFKLQSVADMGRNYWTEAFLGGLITEQDDHNLPSITRLDLSWDQSRWVKDGNVSLATTARDPGLGVKFIDARAPGFQDVKTHPCTGQKRSRCPEYWNGGADPTYTWPVSRFTEGIGQIGVHATDIINRQSDTAQRQIKVDRQGPNPTVGGSLWRSRQGGEAADQTLGEDTYDLTFAATEGVAGAAAPGDKRAGMREPARFELKQQDGTWRLLHSFAASCYSDNCGVPSQTFTFRRADYEARMTDLRLVANDNAANSSVRNFTVDLRDHENPTLKVTGGLRNWPVQTGRSLDAVATDSGSRVRDIRVYMKATTALTPDSLPPADADRKLLSPCSGDCSSHVAQYRPPDSLATGRYQITVEAFDREGNRAEDRWIVTVVQTRSGNRDKLGLEQWFELDDTDAGGESTLAVNGETGNLVWHATPIVNRGRGLSSVVNLTYNSGERGGLLGAELGRTPLIGATAEDDSILGQDLTGLGYREAGTGFSLSVGGPSRVNEPLGGVLAARAVEVGQAAHDTAWPVGADREVSLTDADGTRHVFTRTGGSTAWKAPSGVNLRLRYIGPRAGASLASLTAAQLENDQSWEMLRPDGVRFIFDRYGLQQLSYDRNSNTLDYWYESVSFLDGRPCASTTPIAQAQTGLALCVPRLKEVRQPGWSGADAERAKRKIALGYTTVDASPFDPSKILGLAPGQSSGTPFMAGAAPQVSNLTDASGRKYSLDYHTGVRAGYLKEIREDDRPSPTAVDPIRTTRFKYDENFDGIDTPVRPGDLEQLTHVVPVVGGSELPATVSSTSRLPIPTRFARHRRARLPRS